MDSFGDGISVNMFTIGRMLEEGARIVRQVKLNALSSASLGSLASNPSGFSGYKQYTSGTQKCNGMPHVRGEQKYAIG
jgi:hypothetical protein